MALNYSISMMGNPFKPEEPKKAYAKAQMSGELSLREISDEVASKSTVHRADIAAVLIGTVESMVDGLRQGKQVDFGDLGKFRLQINSEGAVDAESFTSANIRGVTIQFIPGKDLQHIFNEMKFNLVATRAAQAAVIKAQKAGETMVDISVPEPGTKPGGVPDAGAGGKPTEGEGGGSHVEPGTGGGGDSAGEDTDPFA